MQRCFQASGRRLPERQRSLERAIGAQTGIRGACGGLAHEGRSAVAAFGRELEAARRAGATLDPH